MIIKWEKINGEYIFTTEEDKKIYNVIPNKKFLKNGSKMAEEVNYFFKKIVKEEIK